jgi:hypothetical protein
MNKDELINALKSLTKDELSECLGSVLSDAMCEALKRTVQHQSMVNSMIYKSYSNPFSKE